MKNNNRNYKEEKNNSKVYAGGKEYYKYLKNLKKDTENTEYSTSFMMF